MGPSATMEYVKKVSPAIPTLHKVQRHMEQQFKNVARGAQHGVPYKEEDVAKLTGQYMKSKLHTYCKGRSVNQKSPDVINIGSENLECLPTMEDWWRRHLHQWSTLEDWDSKGEDGVWGVEARNHHKSAKGSLFRCSRPTKANAKPELPPASKAIDVPIDSPPESPSHAPPDLPKPDASDEPSAPPPAQYEPAADNDGVFFVEVDAAEAFTLLQYSEVEELALEDMVFVFAAAAHGSGASESNPLTWQEAMHRPDHAEWVKAIAAELTSLCGTFEDLSWVWNDLLNGELKKVGYWHIHADYCAVYVDDMALLGNDLDVMQEYGTHTVK
ncbi:hypothetical protein B0H10DRAFT_1959389 [Mycena sp. CBHHK59/15]|nr:hypothetical protein B0H10DRAFT_1959389 [Mycena sp. CBHHK59/15]